MATDEPPSRRLTVDEIAYLGNVGRLFHSAPGYRAAQDAMDTALKATERYRAEGVSWADITRALAIPREELLHRMQETTDKPRLRPPPPSTAPATIGGLLSLDPPWPLPDHSRYLSASANHQGSASISASSSQSSFFSTNTRSHDRNVGTVTPAGIARRVLFVSGDPRPGRNSFGPEAAYIREALAGSYVQVTEMASVGLAEICPALDAHAPAAVHIAAHSSFGGIHLTQEGGDLCIAHEAFCAQIARVRFPPRLAVLNFCDSTTLAAEIARTVRTVISWPHALSDRQAQTFTRQLYRSLAARRSVGDSCKDAEAALAGPQPDLPPPVLHGEAVVHVF
ncbi:CHAT domain-containing protein [Streptomyces kutzneri]|uniref:CHAT domain-containing protein n=1 Tax=Streptomyces kutzneri TaxID=3051179 RepID=UPI0028D42CE1|nr:CHAT domain-containing protein [Streptomyces sp. DSM 40907]